jgi:hypothetical protein
MGVDQRPRTYPMCRRLSVTCHLLFDYKNQIIIGKYPKHPLLSWYLTKKKCKKDKIAPGLFPFFFFFLIVMAKISFPSFEKNIKDINTLCELFSFFSTEPNKQLHYFFKKNKKKIIIPDNPLMTG